MGLEQSHIAAARCMDGYMAGQPATKGVSEQSWLNPQVEGNTYRTTVKQFWGQYLEPFPDLPIIAGLLSGEQLGTALSVSLSRLPPDPCLGLWVDRTDSETAA